MAQDLHYFEDLEIGDSFEFGPLTISREEVIAFASEFDPQPFHIDDAAAAETHFGEVVARGHECQGRDGGKNRGVAV